MVYELAESIIVAKHKNSGERYRWGEAAERRLERNVEGYMAEMAVASHYGVTYQRAVFTHAGDTGFDLVVGKYTLGVKASRYLSCTLAVKCTERMSADAYVLCFVDVSKGAVRLLGWLWAVEIRRCTKGYLRKGGPLNYLARQSVLRRVKPYDSGRRAS